MNRPLKYLLVLVLCLAPAFAAAQEQTKEELQAVIERAQEEIRLSTELLGKTRQDQQSSQSQLKLVQSRINSRREIVNSLDKQLSLNNREINDNTRRIEELEAQREQLRKDYALMVRESYKNYKMGNFMLFLFSARDFNDITRRIDYMRRYNRTRAAKAEELKSISDSIGQKVEGLARTREEIERTRRTRNTELGSLTKDESQYIASVNELKQQETRLTEQVRAQQQQVERAQRRIEELIAEEVRRAQRANVSAAEEEQLVALSGKFEDNRGRLPFPVKGGVVIDKFGQHSHHIVQSTKVNNPGINIAASAGAEVNCVFEGTVSGIFSLPVMNTCIMVRHGNYITVYANMSSVAVRTGDVVRTSQRLGKINDSRDAESNYLHFEIRRETESLNPEEWLKR